MLAQVLDPVLCSLQSDMFESLILALSNNPLARASLKTPVTLLDSYNPLNFGHRIPYQCYLILKYFDNIFNATYLAIFSGNIYFTT